MRYFIPVLLLAVSITSAYGRAVKFAHAQSYAVPAPDSTPGCVAVGDFNRDGYPDIVVTDHYNSVSVFIANHNGTFKSPITYLLSFYVTGCVAVGDINKDGKLDLVVVGGDTTGNGLALFMGNGDGTFTGPTYQKTPLAGASLKGVLVDLNHDHNLDIFVGGNGSSIELLGDGRGNFVAGPWQNSSGDDVAVGDFSGDGNPDIVLSDYFAAEVGILLGNGDGTFQTPIINSGFFQPLGLAVGDFNRDGKLDVAVTDVGIVIMLTGNGDGTFTHTGQWYAGDPGSIVAADFNKDGKLDLATTNVSGNALSTMLGHGDGTFASFVDFPVGTNPGFLAVADFNRDGSLDVVTTNYGDDTMSVLLNAAGTFVRVTSSLNPSTSGQSVTFTATVKGSVNTTSVPTGAVIFKDGAITLGSVSLSAGKASFTTSSLAVGKHKLTATYSGSSTFNPNTSGTLVQTVN
jgi:hypothetical protein